MELRKLELGAFRADAARLLKALDEWIGAVADMGNRDLKPDEISMEKWFRVTELIVEQGREIHERAEVLKLPTDPSPLLSVDHPSPSAMKQARLALTALDADAEAEILREGQD